MPRVLPVPHPRMLQIQPRSQEHQHHRGRTEAAGEAQGAGGEPGWPCCEGKGLWEQLLLIESPEPAWGERACREGHGQEQGGRQDGD